MSQLTCTLNAKAKLVPSNSRTQEITTAVISNPATWFTLCSSLPRIRTFTPGFCFPDHAVHLNQKHLKQSCVFIPFNSSLSMLFKSLSFFELFLHTTLSAACFTSITPTNPPPPQAYGLVLKMTVA